jgi:hypothetical protein
VLAELIASLRGDMGGFADFIVNPLVLLALFIGIYLLLRKV